jgi:multiple sugar transport system substrate-binding protein
MLNGLNWLLEMQKSAPKGIVSNQGNEKWLSKDNNIAIMLNQGPGDTVKPAYAQGLGDRIGIVNEFKNDEGRGGLFAGSPITIAKNSKNKELAWEWLKFATSDFVQKYVFEEYGAIPAVKSATEWDSVKEMPLMLPVFNAMETPMTPRYPWGSSQPRFILTSEIEAALTGNRSAEDALKKAQKESTEWVENR